MKKTQTNKIYNVLIILLISSMLFISLPAPVRAEVESGPTDNQQLAAREDQLRNSSDTSSDSSDSPNTSIGEAEGEGETSDSPQAEDAAEKQEPAPVERAEAAAEKPEPEVAENKQEPELVEENQKSELVILSDTSDKETSVNANPSPQTDVESGMTQVDAEAGKSQTDVGVERSPADAAGKSDQANPPQGDPSMSKEQGADESGSKTDSKEGSAADSKAVSESDSQTDSNAASEEDSESGSQADSKEGSVAEPEEDSKSGSEVLEKGETLEVAPLTDTLQALGNALTSNKKLVQVTSFDELKKAIAEADDKPTTIIITQSFRLTEALTIGKNQDITLTAKNDRTEDEWEPVKKPADFADQGEAKQRKIIEEGRQRGEQALDKADLDKNPLPSEDKKDIIIKRAEAFLDDSLFKVNGKLTLGTEDYAVYIDGNGDQARTAFDNKGSVIDVYGELIMKNAVIMNSYNKHGYTGPIRVNSGGEFTMEGGRISKNTSFEQIDSVSSRPYAAGAVYVKPGGSFTMTNGLIDNNHGGLTGGVFAGDLSGSSGDPAKVEINGGIIANNLSATRFQMGGGINGFPASKITINDGIIAGNKSFGVGGGIGISSQYIGSPSNILGAEKATVNTSYKEYIKTNKAEANINGGLIYKNRALSSGGGIYVDSNDVNLGKTMILDNKAGNFGGGIYIGFPPITQKLEDLLITENKASGKVTASIIGGSNGGGLWNCPTGFVHVGDGHSVYVYNNDSGSYGKDITFSEKTWHFKLNGQNIEGEFYSHISPVTKDKNIIKFLEDGPSKADGVDIPERLSYHALYTHLRSVYSEDLIKEAWKNAKTFIMGNSANNGGGLGSNANLTTPKDEGDYAIEVNKKWDQSIDQEEIPKEIKADLFIVPLDKDSEYVKTHYGTDNSLFKYGEITLGEDNKWHSRLDTNYFNGANKDKILEKLKIKNFSDIGLPDDAYQLDKGLPFTAKELADKGYKYLLIEQGDKFFVDVKEEKPEDKKTVEAGVLEITREYNDTYDNEFNRQDKNLYFYLYDPETKSLTRLGKTTIHEDDGSGTGTTTFAHPLLLKEISEIKSYGADRKFTEYEGWGRVKGYHNKDNGYAFVLTENEDGTLTLEVPYLWLAKYKETEGFSVRKSDDKTDYTYEQKTHSFTLTNYSLGKLGVQKSWDKIDEKDRLDSIDVYLLLDGKRIVDSIDENGNPVYKKLTLSADKGWKGSFEKLNPGALAAGRYSLEEDSDTFAPEFINKKENFKIRIGYADDYREEGQAENEVTSTAGHFHPYVYKNKDGSYNGVKLNLYLDGKKLDTKEFTFSEQYDSSLDRTFSSLTKYVEFEGLQLETYGQPIPVKYYDVISNEPNREEYDFYLEKDANGAYALYLPRLVIAGVPYADLFIAEKLETNPPYDDHEKTTRIVPLKPTEDHQIKVENHYGPTHGIDILKKWIGENKELPDEITLVLTDIDGNTKEIKATKQEDWKKVLDNLGGTLRYQSYRLKEVEVPGFTSEIKSTIHGFKVTGTAKDGKEVSIDYMTDDLRKALASGNYRYEVFTPDQDLDFNVDNIDSFIQVKQQADGRYVIRYASQIKLRETLAFEVTNTHKPPTPPPPETPPKEPPTPPEEPPTPPEVPKISIASPPVSKQITRELIQDLPATASRSTNLSDLTLPALGILLALKRRFGK